MRDNKKIRKPNSILFSNKGTTMMEVVVAFVVLVIIFAMVYQVLLFCSQMRMKAVDTETVFNKFNQEIYKTGGYDSSELMAVPISKEANNGPVFYITVDTEKTNVQYNINNGNPSVEEVTTKMKNVRLGLYHVKATEYKSINPMIQEEKLITPKILVFEYEK